MAILPPCLKFGIDPQTFDLGPGHYVEVSRRGIAVEFEGKLEEQDIPNCPQQVPLVRYTRFAAPPASDGQPRHLIEFFIWKEGDVSGQRGRALEWWVGEVVGPKFNYLATELLVQEPGSIWPVRGVPGAINVHFGWNKRGEATYTITGLDRELTGVLPTAQQH